MRFDAVVAGAGPAGAALAGWLGRAGLTVLLADKARFPREKPCGEGLLPPGARAARAMGLWPELCRSGRALRGLSYHCGELRAHADFPPGEEALGIGRYQLDWALLRWALASGNVRFEEGARIDEPLWDGPRVAGGLGRSPSGKAARWEAPLLICAEGRHSTLRARLGVRFLIPRRRRMALVGRLEGVSEIGDRVEVFLDAGREAYLTPVAGGVHAALLYDAPVGLLEPGRLLELLRAIPALGPRLSGARLCGPPRAWGPLGGRAERGCGPGFLLAGDSALALDPIAGEGVSLALASAEAGRGLLADPPSFDRLRRKMARVPRALSALLLALTSRGWLARGAVRELDRRPALFRGLLAAASR